MRSMYSDRLRSICPGYDPRHIEAYMRLEHSTLDGLTRERFVAEAQIAMQCVSIEGRATAERLAHSFGL